MASVPAEFPSGADTPPPGGHAAPAPGCALAACIAALERGGVPQPVAAVSAVAEPDSEAALEEALNAVGRTARALAKPQRERPEPELLGRLGEGRWLAVRPSADAPADAPDAEEEDSPADDRDGRATGPESATGAAEADRVEVYGLDGGTGWQARPWSEVAPLLESAWRLEVLDDNARGAALGRRAESRWGWLTRPLRRQSRGYVLAVVASVFANLLAVAGSFYALHVYDRVVPTGAISTLLALTIGVGIAYLFEFLLQLLRSYFLDHSGKSLDREVSRRLFSRALGMHMRARPTNAGVFASHFREFESIRDFLSSLTLATLIDLPFAFFFIGVIALIAGPVALVPLIALPVVIAIALALQVPLARAVKRAVRGTARKQGMLVEALAGIETIKALGAEERLKADWGEAVDEAAECARQSRLISTVTTGMAKLIQQFAYAGVIVTGVYLTLSQQLTMGGIIACSILVGRAMQPMGQLSGLLTRAQQTRQAAEQVREIAALPSDMPAGRRYVRRPIITGDAALHQASFSYPGQDMPALREVSVRIRAGERIGIVGRSGSGKSTFLRLLMGLYEPDSGSVSVGGVDTRQLAPSELRRAFGFLGQDGFLFNGTIVDNIGYGRAGASDEEIVAAARAAGVEAFTAATSDGLYTEVGELGRRLSGGQRQAVCLARALVRDGAFLALDEPTNSLDHGNEQRLRAALAARPADETLLLITHHAGLFEHVDRLLVFEQGRLALDGAREEGLARLRGAAGSPAAAPGSPSTATDTQANTEAHVDAGSETPPLTARAVGQGGEA